MNSCMWKVVYCNTEENKPNWFQELYQKHLYFQVEFANGVDTAAIVITVTADSFPELDETSTIQLTSIVNPGTTHPGRGARISEVNSAASLTVLANDSPHGVFAWTLNSLFSVVNEPEGSQPSGTVVLHVLREQGSTGAVNIRYR